MIDERCLRTQFISPIGAPDRSSAALTACLSASVSPGAGKLRSAEPPPGDEREHEVVRAEALDHAEDAPGRRLAAGVGDRMGRLDDLNLLARDGVAVTRDDEA